MLEGNQDRADGSDSKLLAFRGRPRWPKADQVSGRKVFFGKGFRPRQMLRAGESPIYIFMFSDDVN